MRREWDDDEIDGFLKENRPLPPSPPNGEYRNILAVLDSPSATAPSGDGRPFFVRLAWAAAVVVAVGLGFTLGHGTGKTDTVVSSNFAGQDTFIIETVSASLSPPQVEEANGVGGWNIFFEETGEN